MVKSTNGLTVRLCSLQPWIGSYRILSVMAKLWYVIKVNILPMWVWFQEKCFLANTVLLK